MKKLSLYIIGLFALIVTFSASAAALSGYLYAEHEDGTPIKGYRAIGYGVENNKLTIALSLNGLADNGRYYLYLENPGNIEYDTDYGYPAKIRANHKGSYSSRDYLTIDPGEYNNVRVHLDCYDSCAQDVYSVGTFDFEIGENEPQPPEPQKPWWCRWWPWHHRCR